MAAAQARPESTAVATVPRNAVAKLLDTDAARQIIMPLLGQGADYGRVMQETYLAVRENPDILECTKESIVRAVAKAVSWDLVIGETVHLVPFNVKISRQGEQDAWEKRLKAVQDYKGKVELIVRSGSARSISAECVYAGDFFEMELGTHPMIRHRPEMDPAKRGAMLGAYAAADLGQRHQPVVKWMTVAEVEEIRSKHSKQWKRGELPPWYARKTAVHQLAKLLPKNPRLAAVLRAFEEEELEEFATVDTGPVATVPAPRAADEHRGPRPLATSGMNGYDDAPVPPAQHSDDPGASDEDYIDDSDLVD